MIERNHPMLSVGAQCSLLSISQSSFHYAPQGETAMNLNLMLLIDKQWWFWMVSAPVLVQIPRPFSFERRAQSGVNPQRFAASVFGRQFRAQGSEGEKREDFIPPRFAALWEVFRSVLPKEARRG